MEEYVKINTIWKRDDRGVIQVGEYATPEMEYLAGVDWSWTEKVDGTNVRVGWDGEAVELGGRGSDSQMPLKLVAALRGLVTPERLGEVFGAGEPLSTGDGQIVLYGEGYGPGVQGGGAYRRDQSFVLFDVKVGQWWLRRPDVEDVAVRLGLDVVPVVAEISLQEAADLVAGGLPSRWSTPDAPFLMEGLVGRPLVDLFDRKGERVMAKIKTKDYGRLRQVREREEAAARAALKAQAEADQPVAAAATT